MPCADLVLVVRGRTAGQTGDMSTAAGLPLASFVREHLNTEWKNGCDLDDALVQGIIAAIRSALGPEVTAEQVNSAFPVLPRMKDFGIVDLRDPDAVIDRLDPYLAAAEGLPESFWRACDLQFHEVVVKIRSGEQGPSVDLGLVTDGETDWWFTFLNSTAGENGFGPPTPATREARRGVIDGLLSQGVEHVGDVTYVTTSLRGSDLEWLTHRAMSIGALTQTVDGSLQGL
jgi:hypothetical protein